MSTGAGASGRPPPPLVRVDDPGSAPVERRTVGLDRCAVQLDGPLDGGCRQRDRAGLEGHTEQEHVGGDGRAEQTGGERAGVDVAVEGGPAAEVELGDVGQQASSGAASGLPTMRPVGVRVVEAMTTLVAGSRPARLAGVTEVSRSKPSSTSIVPGRVSPIEVVGHDGAGLLAEAGLVDGARRDARRSWPPRRGAG